MNKREQQKRERMAMRAQDPAEKPVEKMPMATEVPPPPSFAALHEEEPS